ncbi:MAG: segregation/condensation protein A [Candidatus Liptonbacteria bacterium]|nr:segregation/condensation protein A [Candidatus Liptonbacteria bacterium]
MSYQLALEQFQGPIAKLLQLIEEKQLDITEVSLAKVTDDFLRYLQAQEQVAPAVLAEFVAVASRLLLIKSKMLLPDLALTEEEEAEIHDLEQRLAFYKLWRPAEKCIAAAFRGSAKLRSRPYFLSTGAAFYPSSNLTREGLAAALEGVVKSLSLFTRETETLKERIIAIEEKIAEVLARLTQEGAMSFRAVAGERHIAEVVALFLAVLHLAREGRVHLAQKGNFSDIIVAQRDARQVTSDK